MFLEYSNPQMTYGNRSIFRESNAIVLNTTINWVYMCSSFVNSFSPSLHNESTRYKLKAIPDIESLLQSPGSRDKLSEVNSVWHNAQLPCIFPNSKQRETDSRHKTYSNKDLLINALGFALSRNTSASEQ